MRVINNASLSYHRMPLKTSSGQGTTETRARARAIALSRRANIVIRNAARICCISARVRTARIYRRVNYQIDVVIMY